MRKCIKTIEGKEIMRIKINNLDLKQIAESGQCFRWVELGPNQYGIPVFGTFTIVEQTQIGILDIDCTSEEWKGIWAPYFDAEINYGLYIQSINPKDNYLQEAINTSFGVRILKQDLWETMVTFVISQNNNISRIKGCIEKICQRLGILRNYKGHAFYTFPDALTLAEPGAMEGLGLGYREKYITLLAQNVAWNGLINLAEIESMSYGDARATLKSIYGIGDKIADCICLFGLGFKEAFPIDRWINRVIEEQYDGKFPIENYAGYAGVIQQYIFHNEMVHK